ncbi:hypothetical protein HMPREF1092_03261 [Clostridium thermobutyricum]|uniref:Uncharacterized protein n=1 Tax=Clostridium thermobutyricum TaxID=29372 RepID=N9XT68_9CLOT|nr:hypothetical protein [Clostridium thermobutyricum]ENY98781.1 hypothetical protein HMPREF1092_03261 [Clostridium thermobutyricum]
MDIDNKRAIRNAKVSISLFINKKIRYIDIIEIMKENVSDKIFEEWKKDNLYKENGYIYYKDFKLSNKNVDELNEYLNYKLYNKIEKYSELNWDNTVELKGPISELQISAFNRLRKEIYNEEPLSNEEILANFNKTTLSKELDSLFKIYRYDRKIYIKATDKQLRYLNKLYRKANNITNNRYNHYLELDRRVAAEKISKLIKEIEAKNNLIAENDTLYKTLITENNEEDNDVDKCIVIDIFKYKNRKS